MFSHIHFQSLSVSDTARATAFYRDQLGFVVERDDPYEGDRWVFLRIPGSSTLLHLDRRKTASNHMLPDLVLAASDVDVVCDTLRSRGVPIKNGPADAPWAPGTRWAMIDDSEGNLVLIQTVPRL